VQHHAQALRRDHRGQVRGQAGVGAHLLQRMGQGRQFAGRFVFRADGAAAAGVRARTAAIAPGELEAFDQAAARTAGDFRLAAAALDQAIVHVVAHDVLAVCASRAAISHSTRNSAISAMQKSAKATFQAPPCSCRRGGRRRA
jgi:hypothetical protein